ncbi:MAG: T9SS type A sorting domain-containing protein [Prolixibacteraceae bacterium]|nr:T9SS type A sorting domain-containing protein [Prolixibacteraceae bacterium]
MIRNLSLLIVCLLAGTSLFSQNRELDSLSLVSLYRATNGDSWTDKTNWLENDLDTWYGVILSDNNERVYILDLQNNNLTGNLPDSVGNLTGLGELNLSNNQLTGELPDTIGYLTSLSELYLNNNRFSGTLPESITLLNNLRKLYIENNTFSGNLPTMNGMPSLEIFRAGGNLFTFENLAASGIFQGTINIFNYTPQDTIFTLNTDSINIAITDDNYPGNTYAWYKNGTLIDLDTRSIIPPGEGEYNCLVKNADYPALTLFSDSLDFLYNHYSDSLALEALYAATNGDDWIDTTNWLTDEISTWYGIHLDVDARVDTVNLKNDSLTGTLPVELANLSKLFKLDLSDNFLTGDLPPLERITSLDEIHVANNQFTFANLSASGLTPADVSTFEFAPQDTSFTLDFDEYDVSLTVPDGEDTSNIYTWYNGTTVIADTTRTIILTEEGEYTCEITNRKFTGYTYKTDTFTLNYTTTSDSLALVHLYNETTGESWNNNSNWLSGRLATWHGITLNGDRVSKVLLPINNLDGPIPEEIGNLTKLEELDLSNNSLSNNIPAEIGSLDSLEILMLNGNQLSDSIPVSIGNLIKLTNLNLGFNQLVGNIPAEIGALTNLINLDLSNNLLDGTIPAQIANLTNLYWLILSNNGFTGTIPAGLEGITSLMSIELGQNELTGTIPTAWGDLSGLTILSLKGNQLTGTIPASFSLLTNLNYLELGENQLDGTIPGGICDLTSLLTLELHENGFTGTIPADIGNLTSLNNLKLHDNNFTGNIPAGIENLSSLDIITLDSNNFIGDLPLLNSANDLYKLSVCSNKFTFENLATSGLLPVDIDFFYYAPQDTQLALFYSLDEGTLEVIDDDEPGNTYTWYKDGLELEETTDTLTLRGEGDYNCEVSNTFYTDLTLYSDTFTYAHSLQTDSIALVALYNATDGDHWDNKTNWLTGNLDTWFGITLNGTGDRVTRVDLYNNSLSGALPFEIGNLTEATHIRMQNNQLSDTLPDEICDLESLTSLQLNNNQLEGPLPDFIGNLTSLTTLYLNSNQISGTIPPSIGQLTNLDYLLLNSNSLTGVIPSEIGELAGLITLNLNDNQLENSLPEEMGELTSLFNIHLSGNQFTGNIPDWMGNLNQLRIIDLSNNQFNGQVPAAFSNLGNLRTLNLSGNELEGDIPGTMAYINNLQDFNIANNQYIFSNIEPIFIWNNFDNFSTSFTYSPQAYIGIEENIEAAPNQPLWIDITGYDISTNDEFQWYRNDTLLVGKTDSSLFIPSVTNIDTGYYHCEVTNTVATQLTLITHNIHVELNGVPRTIALSGLTVGNGEDQCYGATDTITVAGDGSVVEFENGSTVTLIAGKMVRLLHGFHARPGSNVQAYITTTASFCDAVMPESIVMNNDKSGTIQNSHEDKTVNNDDLLSEKSVKIYPNPTTGLVNVELTHFGAGTVVKVLNLSGAVVKTTQASGSGVNIDLSSARKGIYIVQCNDGETMISRKIVVR